MLTFLGVSNAFDGRTPKCKFIMCQVNSSRVDGEDIITPGCPSLSYQQGAFRFYVSPLIYACFRGRSPQ